MDIGDATDPNLDPDFQTLLQARQVRLTHFDGAFYCLVFDEFCRRSKKLFRVICATS